MPVQKFRSIADMNAADVRTTPGEGFERFVRHCARYWAVAPRSYPRGVVKFRTIDEAQAARARISAGLVAGIDPLSNRSRLDAADDGA